MADSELTDEEWGLTLGDDGKNRFIVLPDGTDFDTETPLEAKKKIVARKMDAKPSSSSRS